MTNEKLQSYLKETNGIGILSTADKEGRVDAAVYAKPHFLEDGTVAFIMRDRLTHLNLQSNPYAAYLFAERGPGYKGQRLFLKKVGEEQESERLYRLRRRKGSTASNDREVKFLVVFSIEKILPLIGSGEEDLDE